MSEITEIVAEIDEIYSECATDCQLEHFSGTKTERCILAALIYIAKLLRQIWAKVNE